MTVSTVGFVAWVYLAVAALLMATALWFVALPLGVALLAWMVRR